MKKQSTIYLLAVFIIILLQYGNINVIGTDPPHYLDGTILDGKNTVVITLDGNDTSISANMTYDYIISLDELMEIENEARDEHYQNYSIDVFENISTISWGDYSFPNNRTADDNQSLISEYIDTIEQQNKSKIYGNLSTKYFGNQSLVETFNESKNDTEDEIWTIIDEENLNYSFNGSIYDDENFSAFFIDEIFEPELLEENELLLIPSIYSQTSSGSSGTPHEINGVIEIVGVFPTDDWAPITHAYGVICTIVGAIRFKAFDSVDEVQFTFITDEWNANDVEYATNLNGFREDLAQDFAHLTDESSEDNVIVIGWPSIANLRNGIALGQYVIVNSLAPIEIPAYSLVQHEVSHCFGAPDHIPHLPWPICPWCVMNYFYLHFHWPLWCGSCYYTIDDNIEE